MKHQKRFFSVVALTAVLTGSASAQIQPPKQSPIPLSCKYVGTDIGSTNVTVTNTTTHVIKANTKITWLFLPTQYHFIVSTTDVQPNKNFPVQVIVPAFGSTGNCIAWFGGKSLVTPPPRTPDQPR